MKNIDKIKQMSASQLALIIMCPKEYDENFKRSCKVSDCYNCALKYLNDEVK